MMYRSDLAPDCLTEVEVAALDAGARRSKNILEGRDGCFLTETL
jgi:hypothetical protein